MGVTSVVTTAEEFIVRLPGATRSTASCAALAKMRDWPAVCASASLSLPADGWIEPLTELLETLGK